MRHSIGHVPMYTPDSRALRTFNTKASLYLYDLDN